MNNDIAVASEGDYLSKYTIALVVSGSIAAIGSPKIVRQLRRYGATVRAYVSPGALRFVGKDALTWACGIEAITESSGLAEHILTEDAVLVAPATANVIAKFTNGIADSTITTLLASAMGQRKPIFFMPTMHLSLAENPFLVEKMDLLKNTSTSKNVFFLSSIQAENKWKSQTPIVIASMVAHLLNQKKSAQRKIFITAGPCAAPIDSVRYLTNHATGKTGLALARHAIRLGAHVVLLLHDSIALNEDDKHLFHKHIEKFSDYNSYRSQVLKILKSHSFDSAIFSAAVTDYQLADDDPLKKQSPHKISSQADDLHLSLQKTKKVIDEVRSHHPNLTMVSFKYEVGLSEDELLSKAKEQIDKGYQYVVANQSENLSNASDSNPKTIRGFLLFKEKENLSIVKLHTQKDLVDMLILKCFKNKLE